MQTNPESLKELKFVIKKKLRKILPTSLLNVYFSLYPLLGDLVFNKPSQKIKVIGITGTDGKSSTVFFTAKILQEAGYKTGFFSSIAYGDGNNEQTNGLKMTMPGRLFIQKFLGQLVKNHCEFAVLEVTSEGVKQKRHLFINFDITAITNLKPEHIESHGGFENYKSAKAAIFKSLHQSYKKGVPKTIIVNNEDVNSKDFLEYKADKKLTFGTQSGAATLGKIIQQNLYENIFEVAVKNEVCRINMDLGGPFIVDNALAATTIATSLGVELSVCKRALEKITNIPGRFDIASRAPVIIVDYAHTVAAVEKILSFVRSNWPGKIIHIFGAAGGGRDKWKRPLLAELSERFTDFSILSEENSFDEPVEEILQDIYVGFKSKERVILVPDRRDAVKEALSRVSKDSLLLFTAKGSETVIAGPLGRKKPYNEKEFIQACLSNKN